MSNTVLRLFVIFTLAAFPTIVDAFVSNGRKCPRFEIKKRTIIKTQASKANGAIYIGTSKVSNSRGCYDQCCANENCNLVLLKFAAEEQVTCFLFDCGSPSKCLYHTHSSYRNYAALQFDDPEVDDDSSLPTTRKGFFKVHTTAHIDQDTTKKYHWQSQVGKINEENRPWNEEPSTPTPYHAFVHPQPDPTTKPNNTQNWWHKMSTDYHNNKKDIFTTSSPVGYTNKRFATTKASTVNNWYKGTKKEKSYPGYDGSESTFDRNHVSAGSSATFTKAHEEYHGGIGKKPQDEKFERRVWIDHNPDYPEKPKQHSKKPKSTIEPTQASTKEPADVKTSFIVNIRQNKAVIPLAVGLVIALLLLVAVVFRLKTSRRRRTKAFLTDDADYLINGMYL